MPWVSTKSPCRPKKENSTPPRIKSLQSSLDLVDPLRKVFPTQAALAFLLMFRQIGNPTFVTPLRPSAAKHRDPRFRPQQQPAEQQRRQVSSCRLSKSNEIALTVSHSMVSF